MDEHHGSESERFTGWGGALGALEAPSNSDPSLGFADPGLLARLAEEMYGELAFARAANSHPRSTLARGATRAYSPVGDRGVPKTAAATR
jgi:hypothetical protein